ncbi:MAG: type II secretion system F family protein, partial [Candidatus Aenigmarchaeota archaeon]|nr:type II secretion system F family protein [Candidatus Aenigmarchaeota archaeon]
MYKLTPAGYRRWLQELLTLVNSKTRPDRFANYAFAIALAIGFIVAVLFKGYFVVLWPAVFLAAFLLFHGTLVLAVERRTAFAESILPDVLQIMASNSRAGHIPSRAFLLSARPEFGPLADGIRNVGKEIMTGKTLEESLAAMSRYIRSEMLQRTTKLIAEGIRSGGDFASLLEENANDIRRIQLIRKEMQANVAMYTIFIIFAACIAAPALYAITGFMIQTIASIGGTAKLPDDIGSNVRFAKFAVVKVDQEFFFRFSLAAILITSFFSGILLGL